MMGDFSMKSDRRSKQEWMELIHECRTSGMTASAWCEQHSIPRKSYTNAVSRLVREGLVERVYPGRFARQPQEIVDISSAAGTAALPGFQPAVVLKTASYCIGISNLAQPDIIRSAFAALQQLC